MFFFCFCAVHLYLFVSNILHSNCHRKLISWQPKRQLFRTQITPIELCLGEHQLTFSCSQKYYKVSNVGWYSAKQSYTNDKQHASNYIFMVVYVHVVYEDPRMPQRRSWNWRPGTSWSSTPPPKAAIVHRVKAINPSTYLEVLVSVFRDEVMADHPYTIQCRTSISSLAELMKSIKRG